MGREVRRALRETPGFARWSFGSRSLSDCQRLHLAQKLDFTRALQARSSEFALRDRSAFGKDVKTHDVSISDIGLGPKEVKQVEKMVRRWLCDGDRISERNTRF